MESFDQKINRDIETILKTYKTVAVVGLSESPLKASHGVAAYLNSMGYRIIPVNPNHKRIMGLPSYAKLEDIPETVDVVDIFRPADQVLPIVEAAVRIGSKAVWLQTGIVNERAAEYALQAGLRVVMDRCMKVEHMRQAFKR